MTLQLPSLNRNKVMQNICKWQYGNDQMAEAHKGIYL